MTIGFGLIIIQSLDAFASAVSVPAGHSAAERALAMKQERGCHQGKNADRDSESSFCNLGHSAAGATVNSSRMVRIGSGPA
jgi:hypothetical protein